MENFVIDTDPGVDDALAITFACFSQLNIIGITTVFGNSTIKNSTQNALTILEINNKKIPVYQGTDNSLNGFVQLAESHSNNGLGGFNKKLKTSRENINAVVYLIKLLQNSKSKTVSIVCLGPTTNIALLIGKRPDLVKRIKRLIILGGVFGERGNISDVSEFNTYNDPIALSKVLTINCEKILIPINVCQKVVFTKQDFEKIRNNYLKTALKKIVDIYINYYVSNKKYGGFKGGVMYDLLAVSYCLNKRLFKIAASNVSINTNKGSFYGQTIIKKYLKPNCTLVTDVNEKTLKKDFFKKINLNQF